MDLASVLESREAEYREGQSGRRKSVLLPIRQLPGHTAPQAPIGVQGQFKSLGASSDDQPYADSPGGRLLTSCFLGTQHCHPSIATIPVLTFGCQLLQSGVLQKKVGATACICVHVGTGHPSLLFLAPGYPALLTGSALSNFRP